MYLSCIFCSCRWNSSMLMCTKWRGLLWRRQSLFSFLSFLLYLYLLQEYVRWAGQGWRSIVKPWNAPLRFGRNVEAASNYRCRQQQLGVWKRRRVSSSSSSSLRAFLHGMDTGGPSSRGRYRCLGLIWICTSCGKNRKAKSVTVSVKCVIAAKFLDPCCRVCTCEYLGDIPPHLGPLDGWGSILTSWMIQFNTVKLRRMTRLAPGGAVRGGSQRFHSINQN